MTDAQIEQMKRQGTWYCPTLSPYYGDWAPADTPAGKRDRARAAVHEDTFKRALKARLKIVFGTDMGGMPWTEPIAQEFGRMVELGMAPMDAIQSATSRPAEMLGMKGEIGGLASGAYAEVIAVSGDPLKDVGVLEARLFALSVQDRVIRLEERLRYERILPEELRWRADELTPSQFISLRFASDDELPALMKKVLDERVTQRKAIKQLIKNWRPDYLRA